MVIERSKQIAALRRAYPMLSAKGILSTRYRMPIRAVDGSSNCILEIRVPLTYPNKQVEIRLINPIPHAWATRDGTIRCPEWLRGATLVCVMESVMRQFRERGGHIQRTITESNVPYSESVHRLDTLRPGDLDERIKEIARNPPTGPFAALIEANNEDVEHLLSNEDQQLKLLYRNQHLSKLLSDLAKVIRANESIALSVVSRANKKHKLLEAVKKKIQIIDTMNISDKDIKEVKKKFKSAYKTQIDQRIASVQREIYNTIQAVRNSDTLFELCYDKLSSLYRTYNELVTIRLSIFG